MGISELPEEGVPHLQSTLEVPSSISQPHANISQRQSESTPPISAQPSSYLHADHAYSPYNHGRDRSRSRGPRSPPPPPPIVEDEHISLAKEQHACLPSYDPPSKGVLDQRPMILEADISEGEAARLHEADLSPPKVVEKRRDKRFGNVPREDTGSSTSDSDIERKKQRKRDSGKVFERDTRDDRSPSKDTPSLERRRSRRDLPIRPADTPSQQDVPPLERRRSRQELPSIETKVPREVPPQYRRSASAYTSGSRIETPQSSSRQSGEYFLSPEALRPSREYFTPSSAPKQNTNDFGGRASPNEKRHSGSYSSSRPTTPSIEKRHSGGFDARPVSRHGHENKSDRLEKMTPVSNSEKRYSGGYENARPPSRKSSHERHEKLERLTPMTASKPTTERRQSANLEAPRPPSRRNSGEKLERPERLEKLTRSQQLAEGSGRRPERPALPERKSTAPSTRSSRSSRSSDDEYSDSDSDRRRRRRHRSHQLHPGDDRHLRSSSKHGTSHRPVQPTSRFSSPLPSPKVSPSQLPTGEDFARSTTFPIMKKANSRPSSPLGYHPEQKLNIFDVPSPGSSRPHSRQSSQSTFPVPIPMPIPMPSSIPDQSNGALPIPIPSRVDVYSPGETKRAPVIPNHEDDRSSTVRPQEKPLWQVPKFQPPTHLEKPVGSYRRYSEDIDRGTVTPLPTCPRKDYVRGRNDWLTLPQCPGFDICPSCYRSTMVGTKFQGLFVPSPPSRPDTEIRCDFGSSPWYRIAWLLTLKERLRDLVLFHGLARVAATTQPCLGSTQTYRQWYSIIDPKARTPIRNFDVCQSCVKSIEVLLPAIRGILIPTDVHLTSPTRRVCDLRFDSKRFVQYFDALETTADQSFREDLPPDTRALASLVRRFAAVEECEGEKELRDAKWHLITQLPEFTVCPECFDEIVWPELQRRKAIPLMFKETPQRLPRASCQLYSARMRGIFRLAVEGDDYKLLAGKARERRSLEERYKKESAELKMLIANGGGSRRLEDELEVVVDDWKDVE